MLAVRGLRALALALAFVLTLAGVVLGAAIPARATAGLIDGYVYEIDGTTPIPNLTVTFDDGSVPPAYVTAMTDVNGYYAFTPAAGFDLAPFAIVVNGGNAHLDDYDVGFYDTGDASSGEVPDFLLDVGRRITGVVRDAATGSGVPDVLVTAIGSLFGPFVSLPPTDSSGVFSIAVAPGDDYEIEAGDLDNDYEIQLYDHINGCSCSSGDLIHVPAPGPPITGIDFDLLAFDDWILFSVLAQKAPIPVDYPGVLIFLDRWDGSHWQQVDSRVTDSTGIAELYGYAPGPATQDFRVRFSIGGVAQTVLSYDDYIGPPFPPWDGGSSVHLLSLVAGGCGCGGSFAEQDLDLLFAAYPATGGGGGGGSTPPMSTPRPRTGTSAVATLPSPIATPTPTPTPASTPTPSALPSSSPSASPTPTSEPEPTGDASAGSWWFWILLAVILALIGFVVVRVFRRRP